jgi:polyphosphate kinase
MMHRNLDRRVEVLVRLPETQLVDEVNEMLDLAFAPDTFAWELKSDGDWVQNAGRTSYQDTLIERHRRRRTGG